MATVSHEPQPPQAPRAADPTLGRLVNDALTDVSTLVRSEIALAKAEITADVKKGGVGAGMLAAAGFVALLGVIFLLHTIARAIAIVLPVWAGYLIVTLVLFVVAGILALMGKKAISKVKGKPQRAITTTKSTLDAVKASASGEATETIRRDDPSAHGASRSISAGVSGAQATGTSGTTVPAATASTAEAHRN